MKRIKATYPTLHVLKPAQPNLRKAIISNCERDLVNCISECVLNGLNDNIAMTGFDTRKLRKHNLAPRNLVDKQVPLSVKKRIFVRCGGFLLPFLAVVLLPLASLIAA
jgi:hypothetical protein